MIPEEIRKEIQAEPEWKGKDYPGAVVRGDYTLDQALLLCASDIQYRLAVAKEKAAKDLRDFRIISPDSFCDEGQEPEYDPDYLYRDCWTGELEG